MRGCAQHALEPYWTDVGFFIPLRAAADTMRQHAA